MEKILLNGLALAYHPISNQLADWLWDDAEIRGFVKRSNLYMIAQREEIFFDGYGVDPSTNFLTFSLASRHRRIDNLSLDTDRFMHAWDGEAEWELGKQFFRLWSITDNKREKVLRWFTVEKLLWEHSRGTVRVPNLKEYRDLMTFRLLYVGISKQGDSFSRLFAKGHEKRAKILSNESQLRDAARLTDELFIFLFDVHQTRINSVDPAEKSEVMKELFELSSPDKMRIVADAEKAFVKILNTKYNTLKYTNYPYGVDGLYNQGFDRYGYFVDEDITFQTESALIRGGYAGTATRFTNPDLILVEGDTVNLVKVED
ncbi:hypothetical protein POL68_18520 [Stigmatella sp. ncwal1]|uniref:Uncharacterized protein n=1 Tax=Stigmatella ashevillensis TaxID=2995309 RepID=A0ABT5DA31_9BACT|nr:hypothetical protein [Stigmatella ashevillena]MDC0710479.1 hypothetical protein [Stigmatella ashevillena]